MTQYFGNFDSLVIAEVGQNHQGSLDLAKEYVRQFKLAGADAVKFQVRSNADLFDSEAFSRPYDSENSFAPTYGAHREALELSHNELHDVKALCDELGVIFMCTPFDEPSLEFLVEVGCEILKVASFDLGNVPFLEKIARTGKPVVMSCGGGMVQHIDVSVAALEKGCKDLAILHCVSEYPCSFDRLGLDSIEKLAARYPTHTIGLSDHFNGILSGPLGYMKGARVFEKHVTLNRSWKGTDHGFALEPEGFRRFCRDIKRTPFMFKAKTDGSIGSEPVFQKLGKSLIAKKAISRGQKISSSDLSGRIFTLNHIPVRDSSNFIDKIAARDISAGEPLKPDDVVE